MKREGVRAGEIVPQLLEPNGGRMARLRAEERHQFAEDGDATASEGGSLDETADRGGETRFVYLPIRRDLGEDAGGIELRRRP